MQTTRNTLAWRWLAPTGVHSPQLLGSALSPLQIHRGGADLPPLLYTPEVSDPGTSARRCVDQVERQLPPPAFVLMVGPPAALPWLLQIELSARGYLVGRLPFDDVESVSTYVARVLECEREPPGDGQLRQGVWVAPEWDGVTHQVREMLRRLADDVEREGLVRWHRPELEAGPLWSAVLAALRSHPGALLLLGGHGLGWEGGGAGLGTPRLGSWEQLRPDWLESSPALEGGVAVLHCCYSAGISSRRGLEGLPVSGLRPEQEVVSELARRWIASEGGPLALIGHVDVLLHRGQGGGEDTLALGALVRALANGAAVGEAMTHIQAAVRRLERRLWRDLYGQRMGIELPEEERDGLEGAWLQWAMLRQWVVLGDPGVALRAHPGRAAQEP